MAHTAYLPIIADRYGAVVRHIFLKGYDLRGVDMRAQVRLYGDVPGDPLVDLRVSLSPTAQGLRVVDVLYDDNSVPTSHVTLIINETTMESLPYAGEVGDATTLAWDWQLTISGRKFRLAKGEFQITGDGVTGADAAPVGRIQPYGSPVLPIRDVWTSASLKFGEEQVEVTIDGAELLGGLVASSRSEADRAKESADLAALRLAAFPDYYQGSPGGDASQVGLFAAIKTMSFAAGINMIVTTGRASRGDGGGATYTRWVSPLPALPESGRDIWWTQGADGSRWQIAPAPEHMAAAFGALGGQSIDAGPIINAAFAAPQVTRINLGPLTHYFTPTIIVPSGCILCGVSPEKSWLRVIPLAAGATQPGPRFAVLHQNDVGGLSIDYSLDCARSGQGRGDANRTHGVVIYATAGGSCSGTRVRNVAVHNATGYGQYTTTGSPGDGQSADDIWRENCRAINCGVNFEATGSLSNSGTRGTYADATPVDGGSQIACEALYHHYGAIKDFTAYDAVGRGKAQNGLLVITTDGVDMDAVSYVDPDINVDADFGALIEGRDGNRIKAFLLSGGSIIASALGAVFRNSDNVIRGTTITGLNGAGVEGGTGATIDFHGPDISGNTPASGTTGAYGVVGQGALMRWFGAGRLAAFGPLNESNPASEGAIAFVAGAPLLVPAQGALGVMTTDKMFVFPRSAWTMDFPGSTDSPAKSYWVKLDLSTIRPGGVKDRNKVIITLQPLEFPFPSGSVNNPTWSADVLWIDNTEARIYIMSKDDLTGRVLKARVTEFA